MRREKELAKRSRYYQGMIDLNLIMSGEDYRKLKNSFIIFICLKNPFPDGMNIYTFENRCREKTDITLEDGATKVFVTPDAEYGNISEELKSFLKYIADRSVGSMFTKRLDDAVQEAKIHKQWRNDYMTLSMKFRELEEEAREEGHKEGLKEGLEQKATEMIRNMLRVGLPEEVIAECSGKSLEEIRKMKL